MLLPDINVWLALTFDGHAHHPVAKRWFEDRWRAFTQLRSFSPHVWNDAYLAAFALSGNMEVVTFDKGFTQYTPAVCTLLS